MEISFKEMKKDICLNMLETWWSHRLLRARLGSFEVHIEGETEEQIETATELIMPLPPRLATWTVDNHVVPR